MCSQPPKRLSRWLAGAALTAAVWLPAGTAAVTSSDEAFFRPPVVYEARDRRDPFVQPQQGRLRNVLGRVDIDVLKLTGVIYNPRRSLALFRTVTGPSFGYLLQGGKLFSENHQPVAGITGEVRNSEEAVLRQGDKEIVFRLR